MYKNILQFLHHEEIIDSRKEFLKMQVSTFRGLINLESFCEIQNKRTNNNKNNNNK